MDKSTFNAFTEKANNVLSKELLNTIYGGTETDSDYSPMQGGIMGSNNRL